ncbi:uncharacterized protein L203_105351 [Cryptococcus depauperatus CBS 7841]|uniref:Bacteriophytochrome histidine kinase n=1 Tax=Cryptococcus depauperatus CBS 7841 TaxID=1295531 RepID=A0AAJ8JXB9_9TREE
MAPAPPQSPIDNDEQIMADAAQSARVDEESPEKISRTAPIQSAKLPDAIPFKSRSSISNTERSSTTPVVSPASSSAGPTSPGFPGSFVFPIRSVLQGILPPDSTHHSSASDRRFPDAGLVDESDAGIQTIAEMLQQDKPHQKEKGKSQPAVVTFGGRDKDRDGGTSVAGISTPSGSRRVSETDTKKISQNVESEVGRPALDKHDSAVTIKEFKSHKKLLPSKEPSDGKQLSCLSQESKQKTGNTNSRNQSMFSVVEPIRQLPVLSIPPPRNEGPGPELQHPIPQAARPSTRAAEDERERINSSHGSKTSLEIDELGVRTLISDVSGIIHLGEAGSLSSIGESGTTFGSKRTGTDSASASSMWPQSALDDIQATTTRLAAQQRQQRRSGQQSSRQDNVRSFIAQQAQTITLQDPNAPTPSPLPASRRLEERTNDKPEKDESSGSPGEQSEQLQGQSEEVSSQTPHFSPLPDDSGNQQALDDKASSQQPITSSAEAASSNEEPAITMRFEHVSTEDGHHIVVGREGKLKRCEDEPIITPGAIQGFGVLMVLEEDYDTGELRVRQVSENSTKILGLSPKYLFQLDCFTRLLSNHQEAILRDTLEYIPAPDLGREKQSLEDNGPSVFLLSGSGEPGSEDDSTEAEGELSSVGSSAGGEKKEWTCWVAAHRPAQKNWNKVNSNGEPIAPPDLIILEFELERDFFNPLVHVPEPPSEPSSVAQSASPDSASNSATNTGSTFFSDSTPMTAGTLDSLTSVGNAPRTGQPKLSNMTNALSINSAEFANPQQGHSSHGSSVTPRAHAGERMGLEGIEMDIPLEKILESTTNHAKPLRALERMRRTGNTGFSNESRGQGKKARGNRIRPERTESGRTDTMDVFAVLGQINDQLGAAPDLDTFLKVTVGLVQDICRFHRSLIYQFDEQMNGLVVAELVEWGKTTDLYKDLRFPASDIPPQARDLYKINKVRMLYDRSLSTARMVLKYKEDLDTPLDMTHCYLRAMSPIHLKYLANMGVRSSMSVSIMAFGQLWGLIACHSYGQYGMRVSFPVRQMLRILSDSISKNIERLSYAQRLHTRKLISTIPTRTHPTGYIISNADDLLQIFKADAGMLVIGDGCKLLGHNEQGQAMLAIVEYLRIMKFDDIKAINSIRRDFPDLILPRAPDTIAGLLYVPLTAKAGQDFIVFLRKGQVREVQWAGKPYKDNEADEEASLEPRKSFKAWSETVTGFSRPWSDDQLESAGVLALIYGKFIQVWREKQTATASNQLTAILLSNTSHAVRTPLSQIINTLELALSGNIDSDVRKMLENSHQASRALLFHVHDLLDLTRIETGNETTFNDPFDIRQCIADAVRLYENELARKGIDFRVNISEDLPQYLIGDSRKIKTVVSNVIANSVKFTEEGFVGVHCGLHSEGSSSLPGAPKTSKDSNAVSLEIEISDSGCGIPSDKLEEMFVTLEGAEEPLQKSTGLGLGLAVVARIVEQLNGQLRAESEVGVGTKFFFTLPMAVYRPGQSVSQTRSRGRSSQRLRSRTSSSESNSVVSLHSKLSGAPEIDSFVNDLSGGHSPAPVSVDDPRLKEAEERMNKPGSFQVTDSSYPVRPTRVVEEEEEEEAESAVNDKTGSTDSRSQQKLITRKKSLIELDVDDGPPSTRSPTNLSSKSLPRLSSSSAAERNSSPPSATKILSKQPPCNTVDGSKEGSTGMSKMRVMVVEDDMINSQILQKRLKMDKHDVVAATNGREALQFLEHDRNIDAVLMDIQMPIMDGRTAAREIRKLENITEKPSDIDPFRIDGRIPIFAVSASLYENDRADLAQDFDGWLLKPLDFSRVRDLLRVLVHPSKRSAEVYKQGHWERGGYFRGER